ncbi:hypothetical protein GUJ93_ZPchr0003g17335 [Zizania palustris]|uniref:Uncharacterized protein n=1 Tax=Zizania palustris TaxID=103762 RepID=A0A8J5SDM6_ZIZPA|nr:hypothetical protein GUJ93_ZPchr0003g17335 [Zizania palustris]
MASTLPSLPHSMTGFLTALSPSPVAVSWVESLCAITLATPNEESRNGALDSAVRSFSDSTNSEEVVDPQNRTR